jgi:hypothetical protein
LSSEGVSSEPSGFAAAACDRTLGQAARR